MINKSIQNKNFQQNQHELLIINKLKELSNEYMDSENRMVSVSKIDGAVDFLQSKNLLKSTPFLSTKKEINKNNKLTKKSIHYKWFNYFLSNNPINLLFSIDQFLFEFTKKQPQRRKSGEFQQQLKEKKKLSIFYGHLSKKQLKNLISQSKLYQGYFSKNFFSIIERRLDVVLYRSGLVKNIITARQLISHKKIKVNNQIINIASYQVNPGDIISINKKNKILSASFLLCKKEKQTQILKIIGEKFKKRRSRFTISPNFFYKLQNVKNFKNYKQKKTLKNYIRLLLTKIENRAYLKIKKSNLFFNDLLTKSTKKNICYKKNTFFLYNQGQNFTLYKLKPLLSKQAKSFLLMCLQKNYLSLDRKPLFQNKYTRFIHLLERKIYNVQSYSVKNQQMASFLHSKKDEKKSNYSKTISSFLPTSKHGVVSNFKNSEEKLKKSSKSTLKSFTRKLSVSISSLQSKKESIEKNSFLKSSTIYSRKRTIAIYRNIVYKTLLQMHSSFLYSFHFLFDKVKKKDTPFSIKNGGIFSQSKKDKKKTINTLLTLKFKKHITKNRSRKHILRALRIGGVKPMHIEVSYSLSTAILLYSPQRLNFPFNIDVDLILRSFH